ncbi:MarP family serine protease [Glutamicibacter sp. PS]|uniref:MarP family serine protease n=1 Tax=Glutamicibacter TaxID=1742989 RepID=UPI0028482882|nr:MarP family serine protease [Glutamicibacter sp. PS]MDR4532061.1 MarP family serine protease [Glutamicibacter sp. PS]
MPVVFSWLDAVIFVVLLGFFIAGVRRGFIRTLGDMLGLIAGGVAAFFAIPIVSTFAENPWWRVGLMIGTAAVLILLGQWFGRVIATAIRRWLNFDILRAVDGLAGGIISVLITATVIGALAFSVSSMGMPRLSAEIGDSRMIDMIRKATPDAVNRAISNARSAVLAETIPTILEPFAPPVQPVPEGQWKATDAQLAAKDSSTKISGTAIQCGVNQTGSGFVVGNQLVMTNAHVVAGLSSATVETEDRRIHRGYVVYFDPETDIALLRVEGLEAPALPIAQEDLERGDSAAFLGHPAGGPFQMGGAVVASQAKVSLADIYGENPRAISIYQLTAEIQQGNSGGPLVNEQGQAVGMIFAKSRNDAETGFALSLEELEEALDAGAQRTRAINTGGCISD